ncbi:MAG: hypothetical protein KC910_25785 [Candidatus Eremiobacteraeota bacterium]|nr:hypothetical protein [Candidatus Eremiobacteraeota bacterium]
MKRLFTLLLFAALFAPSAAHDHEQARYMLQDALTINGRVNEVLPAQQMVNITTRGVEMDVPLDNLLFFDDRQIGLDELRPGKRVDARMPAGILGLEPANDDRLLWITVDGEQFARIAPKALDNGVLSDQQVTVLYADGCRQDASANEALRDEARDLVLVQQ